MKFEGRKGGLCFVKEKYTESHQKKKKKPQYIPATLVHHRRVSPCFHFTEDREYCAAFVQDSG